jgi:hypothetical protein
LLQSSNLVTTAQRQLPGYQVLLRTKASITNLIAQNLLEKHSSEFVIFQNHKVCSEERATTAYLSETEEKLDKGLVCSFFSCCCDPCRQIFWHSREIPQKFNFQHQQQQQISQFVNFFVLQEKLFLCECQNTCPGGVSTIGNTRSWVRFSPGYKVFRTLCIAMLFFVTLYALLLCVM